MTSARSNLLRILAFACGLAGGILILVAVGIGRRDGGGGVGSGAPWNSSLGARPRFVDVTSAAGIAFRHENGATGKFLYPEIMGAGVGLFDFDGDGFLDIYFVNGNRLLEKPDPGISNRLYRNNGNWTFTDVTARAGVGYSGFGQGCCAGDYDNDGDQDLYVSNLGPNVLYRNHGDGTFADVTAATGVADPSWGQTCSFLDYDGDGWLDLYVQNYLTYSAGQQTESFIYLGSRKMPDYPSPANYKGSADHLYRNRGDGTFADVSRESGIDRPDGKGMGCACVDIDDDGLVDIFVSNDGVENFLFRNRGNGTFEEVGLLWGVSYDGSGIPEGSMGVDVGDFNLDGRLDLIVPCLRKQSFTLYQNMGGYFADASCPSGLAEGTSELTGFSPNFIDYDNDGDLDLFFSNGTVRSNEVVPPEATYAERYGLRDLLFANDGTGKYADVSSWAGPHFARRLIGRGSAAGDLDNDGDMDLVISNLAGPAAVLRNETAGGHWIGLILVPRKGNRDALGSSVWVEAGGVVRRAAVHGQVTYLSQQDRRVHVGLGTADRIDRITIQWPDREKQVLENLSADRYLTIEQGKGVKN